MANLDFGDRTITSANKEVTIGQQLHAVDALGEKSVGWAHAFEESALKVNLDDVAS
jgi:hypothetical protein